MSLSVRIGAHLSIAGGWQKLISDAISLRCETVQIFSRSPRGGRARPLGGEEAAAAREGLRKAGLWPLIVHTPYLVNIAAPEPSKWEYGRTVLAEDLERAALLGAPWVVVHMGQARELSPHAGLRRCCQALEAALERAGGTGEASGVKLLLENTAGGLGETLEAISWVLENVRYPERLGVCLDTCHAFAAGYELRTPEGREEFLEKVRRLLGSERVLAWHVNDSLGECGSHLDRHAHLGEGRLGVETFAALLAEPEMRGRPLILETPVEGPSGYEPDLSVLERLRRQVA